MEDFEQKSFREVVSELISSAQETEAQAFDELSVFSAKLVRVLSDLRENVKIMEHPPVQNAVKSLAGEFRGATASRASPSRVENLGRSLGLVLFASLEACPEFTALHRDSLSPSPLASSSRDSEIVSEFDAGEIPPERLQDAVIKLKHGSDEELKLAILSLVDLIGDDHKNLGPSDWVESEELIPALFNRLGSSKAEFRLIMIHLLRILASKSPENKEKMAEIGFLSTVVRSLSREEEERREAVGLLLDLTGIPAVRRRLGRIRGCIVMAVAVMSGGEDSVASRDAQKLLHCLSGDTQNALHMAEAGYFKPIVRFLEEGTDMSKILMATALSRMELTDQSRASLGSSGAIEPLARMFSTGKLEAKMSVLNALQNLSSLPENVDRLIRSGIVPHLLQLLFSVTSVLTTLREPVSAILARIAESETATLDHDSAQQMLSLLSLSSPGIQVNLLQALNNLASNPSASKVRRRMTENGAIQLLLPFLAETDPGIRSRAVSLLHALSSDSSEVLSEQIGETDISRIVGIVSSSDSESEKAAAIGILTFFPTTDRKVTEVLKRENLLPVIVSLMSSSPGKTGFLEESVAGVIARFTSASDKKLQLYSAEHGAIPVLVKLLSSESPVARTRAAASLAQLSQNSVPSKKPRAPRWLCVPPAPDAFCKVHDGFCYPNRSFCLVKSEAVPGLLGILDGDDRGADEAALGALATLLHDEIWENGSNYIVKTSRVPAIVKVLESGSVKAQEKALWILERVFRVEEHRARYEEPAQAVLIDLAQKGDSRLKSAIAKLMAQLELLQLQSSYF